MIIINLQIAHSYDKIDEIKTQDIIYIMKNSSVDFSNYIHEYDKYEETFEKSLNNFIDDSKIYFREYFNSDLHYNEPGDYSKIEIIKIENETVKIKHKKIEAFEDNGRHACITYILKINDIKMTAYLY